ncbi:diacylglycerol kinase family protein [Lederbergia citrea]|uniref:diacylglycerol kinase family protein n=1 Tax=Lederbergia citrea TaxID=2833581 RepID=UPI001BC92815|nr:diacylglycerol kinase family protein [Lederbergia citrea]MBS4176297.1 diacylglycerol kinase family protein [Lederbergia citrea]MBS4202858.1 diacylglycerol kinase family protein [Lederbergia citrea]
MDTALKDNRTFSIKRVARSFKYAFHGLKYAAKSERNFQIHLTTALLVTVCASILNINKMEWLFIFVSIFGVIALELVNSALERVVDLATDEIKPLAKQAKDLAAAAVLMYALMAAIIGVVILGPKLLHMIY